MAELIFMTYEQARAEHFKALKDEAKRKMNYWATRVHRSRPNGLNDPAHIKASEYAAEYSYYNDALEALNAQPKWIIVEERLPELDKNVSTLKNRKCVRIGYYSEDCEEWVINDMVAYDEDITHWMPLPSTEGIE